MQRSRIPVAPTSNLKARECYGTLRSKKSTIDGTVKTLRPVVKTQGTTKRPGKKTAVASNGTRRGNMSTEVTTLRDRKMAREHRDRPWLVNSVLAGKSSAPTTKQKERSHSSVTTNSLISAARDLTVANLDDKLAAPATEHEGALPSLLAGKSLASSRRDSAVDFDMPDDKTTTAPPFAPSRPALSLFPAPAPRPALSLFPAPPASRPVLSLFPAPPTTRPATPPTPRPVAPALLPFHAYWPSTSTISSISTADLLDAFPGFSGSWVPLDETISTTAPPSSACPSLSSTSTADLLDAFPGMPGSGVSFDAPVLTTAPSSSTSASLSSTSTAALLDAFPGMPGSGVSLGAPVSTTAPPSPPSSDQEEQKDDDDVGSVSSEATVLHRKVEVEQEWWL